MTTIAIQQNVEISEIDFSQCSAYKTSEPSAFWGSAIVVSSWDIDLSAATYRGEPIEIPDSSYDEACQYVIEQRAERAA